MTSVTRNSTGNYTVTIPDRGNSDYIVQLTVLSPTGLQITAQVIAQTNTTFTVQLYGSNIFLYNVDRDWYFTIKDL
ncbi:hypothetical protein ACSIGC_03950 [Tenacibaculum sp. ZS6-P6]|uniref:hypothetical protein n=1 Tax=Tenacibaculum sp. ZS6-P6 TaxID=3447503 RepID=UPI003F97DD64